MNDPHHATKFWALPFEQAFSILESKRTGLSTADAAERISAHGLNIIQKKTVKGPLSVLVAQFTSPLIFILLFAGGVTLYLGEHIESIVIFSAVGINILFGFYQEYKAENTIEKLATYIKNTARVIRDGHVKQVDASELVPGDIISIEYGNRIPADARIIEATALKIDEAILTGESLPVEKTTHIVEVDGISDRTNFVFTGTYAVSGLGLAVVTHTGNDTEIGKIAISVAQTKRVLTPVQNAVRQISWYIFLIALVIVACVFFLGIVRGESIWDMLILSSAVAVGAVPEALPITLTVILSVGVLSISKKGGLIRKLSAAETLGSTTLVLTDKTGTLTYGELAFDELYTMRDLLSKTLPDLSGDKMELTDEQRNILSMAMSNISGSVEKIGEDMKDWVYTGSPFDRVLLKTIHTFSIIVNEDHQSELIMPFNSTDKYSIAHNDADGSLFILGAPDVLIGRSTLTEAERLEALRHLEELSIQGKRLIAFGRKKHIRTSELTIDGVEILGIFVFSDGLRDDAASSIAFIRSHGIEVKIMTGDLPGTARSIGKEVGIETTDEQVLTGEQIKSLDDIDLMALLPSIRIFARVTPEDKLRIGNLYRKLGEVVAMTGDGVNDSPALKAMDIGISLASGSDVAKSAADMILVDNNFKTITETITEGYKIRANIQKVFVYLMSSSLDEVFVIAGALIAGLALPLNALQIIWINILTGTLPALAFAYEHHYSVSKREKKIFSFKVKFLALGIGALSSVLLFALYYLLLVLIPDQVLARTIFFGCFATYVLPISYSFRNIDSMIYAYNPFSNIRLNIANVIGLALVVLTMYHPFMQKIFDTTFVPFHYLWIIILWNIGNVFVVEFAKYLMLQRRR